MWWLVVVNVAKKSALRGFYLTIHKGYKQGCGVDKISATQTPTPAWNNRLRLRLRLRSPGYKGNNTSARVVSVVSVPESWQGIFS